MMQRSGERSHNLDGQRGAVITKATINAARRMGLNNTVLAKILGLSPSTITRMGQGGYTLSPDDKAYELAVLLLRLFRSIDAILGGDDKSIASWMASENNVLRARPVDLIVTALGLVRTVDYVDSRRAPI